MVTRRVRSACGLLLVLSVAVAPAAPATAAPRAAAAPVRVCAQSQDWRRPDPKEMARTVWRDGRYVDFFAGTVNARVVAYYTHHFLFLTTVSASGVDHTLNLTGLAAARAAPCGSGPDAALLEGREVVIWVLGYRVAAADVTGSTLTLTVEPNSPALDRGYAIVQVPRPGGSWYVRFVLPDGREVARASSPDAICCIDEPAPDAPLPAAFPRPANGLAVLDGAGSLQVGTVAGHERVTQARYLALVRPGTAPVDLARRYAAALAGAGLEVMNPRMNPEACPWRCGAFPASGTTGRMTSALVENLATPDLEGVGTEPQKEPGVRTLDVSSLFTRQPRSIRLGSRALTGAPSPECLGPRPVYPAPVGVRSRSPNRNVEPTAGAPWARPIPLPVETGSVLGRVL